MSDIRRFRGDTTSFGIVLTKSNPKGPFDLTGCSLIMSVSADPNPTNISAIVQQTTGVIEDAEAGRAYFAFQSTDFNFVGPYHYDIQLTTADNKIRTLTKSKLTMVQDITK